MRLAVSVPALHTGSMVWRGVLGVVMLVFMASVVRADEPGAKPPEPAGTAKPGSKAPQPAASIVTKENGVTRIRLRPKSAPTGPLPPGATGPLPPDQAGPMPPAPSTLVPPSNSPPVSETESGTIEYFSPHLKEYGYWREDPQYGTVWIPHGNVVGENFSPYVTQGHWALNTNDDWGWESDLAFGWVVFHHGRWVWVPRVGWAWIAGRRYSPAWVNFRVPSGRGAFLGWAATPPLYIWRRGVAVSLHYRAPAYYVFCPSASLFSPHLHSHLVADSARRASYVRSSRRYLRPSRYRLAHGGPSLGAVRASPAEVVRSRSRRRASPVRAGAARATPATGAPRRRYSRPYDDPRSRARPAVDPRHRRRAAPRRR